MNPSPSTPRGWWFLQPVVLVIEALALGVSFDLRALAGRGGWWEVLGELGIWLPLLLALGVGLGLSLGRILVVEVARLEARRVLLGAVAGVPAFCLLWGLTFQMTRSGGMALTVGWSLSLLTWLACRGLGILPLRVWVTLVREHSDLVVRGALLGLGAYLAARTFIANWQLLAPITLVGVGVFLRLLGQRPWLGEGITVGLDEFSVQIAPGCSGLEGMGLTSVFLLGFIYVARQRLYVGRALMLVPAAVLLAFLFNALRIALLLILGAKLSPEMALSGFHSKAGWVFFCLTALVGVYTFSTWSFTARDHVSVDLRRAAAAPAAEAGPLTNAEKATIFLAPLLVLTLTGLVTESFKTDIDHWYGLRLIAAVSCLGLLLHKFPVKLLPHFNARSLLSGIVGGALATLIWLWLVPRDLERAAVLAQGYQELSSFRGALELGLRFLGGALVIPAIEELAFRGYLMRRLSTAEFSSLPYTRVSWWAVGGAAVAFGALHGSLIIPATACGLLYGASSRISGSLLSAVVGHAVTNAALGVLVLVDGRFDLW